MGKNNAGPTTTEADAGQVGPAEEQQGSTSGSEGAEGQTAETTKRERPTGFDAITVIAPSTGDEEGDKLVTEVPGVGKPPKKSTPRKHSTAKSANKKSTPAGDKKKTAEMVSKVLKSGSHMGAARLGPHWAFSDKECQDIADPLAEILERYDLVALLGKYGDWGALIAALTAAIGPRVMMQMMIQKQTQPLKLVDTSKKKGGTQNVPMANTNTGTGPANSNAGAGGGNGGGHSGGTTDDSAGSVKEFLTGIMG